MRSLFLAFLIVASLAGQRSAAPVLERVVMVSRHGVRAPTRSVAVLDALTKRGWPTWPVGPGEMTEHGAKTLGFMGDFLRATYQEKGLLPKIGCPPDGAVQVWADSLDHRTRQSGDILAERLAPGCKVMSRFASGSAIDPVFDASKTGACPYEPVALGTALAGAAHRAGNLLRPDDRRALEVLQGILAPDACKPKGLGVCLVPPADVAAARAAATLGLGGIVAEGLYLEYAEGFPAADVGWGKAGSEATIRAVMPIREQGMQFLRRTPALAGHRGAIMVRTVLALLNGAVLPEGAPPFPPEAKLIMLAGHDSNLLYVAALMGLDWTLPGQPTMIPPDATLAFEVWREPATGRRTIAVVVYAQTLVQLRDATPLDAGHRPDVVSIAPEACRKSADACKLAPFSMEIERQLAAACGR